MFIVGAAPPQSSQAPARVQANCQKVLLLTRTNHPGILAFPFFVAVLLCTQGRLVRSAGLNPALTVIPTTSGGIWLLPMFLVFTCTEDTAGLLNYIIY